MQRPRVGGRKVIHELGMRKIRKIGMTLADELRQALRNPVNTSLMHDVINRSLRLDRETIGVLHVRGSKLKFTESKAFSEKVKKALEKLREGSIGRRESAFLVKQALAVKQVSERTKEWTQEQAAAFDELVSGIKFVKELDRKKRLEVSRSFKELVMRHIAVALLTQEERLKGYRMIGVLHTHVEHAPPSFWGRGESKAIPGVVLSKKKGVLHVWHLHGGVSRKLGAFPKP